MITTNRYTITNVLQPQFTINIYLNIIVVIINNIIHIINKKKINNNYKPSLKLVARVKNISKKL